MVNMFSEVVPEGSGGKEAGFLSRAPGLRVLATVGTGPIRGLWVTNNVAYVVSGSQFYSLNASWVATLIGSVTGGGPVSMSDNGTQIFIACNPDGFIYNTSTNVFAQITDPDFPGAGSVGYIDGYFIFNQPNSQKFWVTSLLDGAAIDPLDFASAEGYPDDVVALIVDHLEIFLFGSTSVEVWYDAGTPDFPMARIQGAFMEVGCEAAYSVAKLDNSVFWLGSDARGRGIVYRANGYTHCGRHWVHLPTGRASFLCADISLGPSNVGVRRIHPVVARTSGFCRRSVYPAPQQLPDVVQQRDCGGGLPRRAGVCL
jgi:Phage stabilisation protein